MSSRHSVLTNAAAVWLAVGEWVGNVICTRGCIVVCGAVCRGWKTFSRYIAFVWMYVWHNEILYSYRTWYVWKIRINGSNSVELVRLFEVTYIAGIFTTAGSASCWYRQYSITNQAER